MMEPISELLPSKRKMRRDPTLAEKVRILELLQEPNASQSSVARKIGLSQSTISRVVKKREEIMDRWNHNENPSRKRNRPYKNARVDEALLHWFLFAKANKMPISGSILMKQAEVIAKEIGCLGFKPSNGWLWRWKERYRLFFRGSTERPGLLPQEKRYSNFNPGLGHQSIRVLLHAPQTVRVELPDRAIDRSLQCGETVRGKPSCREETQVPIKSKSTPQQMQSENGLFCHPGLFPGYSSSDIFGAREMILLFRAVPYQDEKSQIGLGSAVKLDERVCIWFCCNMEGSEKLRLLVISNHLSLEKLQNSKSPSALRTSESGCLTKELLTEWLLAWDAQLGKVQRKVVLALDAHNFVPKVKLRNITSYMLSPDRNVSYQPFGWEIVSEFRAFYRYLFLEKLLEGVNLKGNNKLLLCKLASQMSLLDASDIINKAWQKVTDNTIRYCFQRSGLLCIGDNPTLRYLVKVEPPEDMTTEEFNAFIRLEECEPMSQHQCLLNPTLPGTGVCRRVKEEHETVEETQEWLEASEDSGSQIQTSAVGWVTGEGSPCTTLLEQREYFRGSSELANTGSLGREKNNERIPNMAVKEERDGQGEPRKVQELREACNIIRQHLVTHGQDMNAFRVLEQQLEAWIALQNDSMNS
ncbi:tigger transposable element-derived protein 3-like [Rhinatrema bivittatum]|uniref:tigger transposable element-derived protein 3-like n=1 Tax=Rhinatrema bivittatum TaxID=194408 RepID=UPI001125F31E|nr:tigger transposable element-derived protein 3-like [Rhinatrema bivittatum]XP_029469476.1 tigger transposable element-derived protein 3-like [Rhinatrema bivittatum]